MARENTNIRSSQRACGFDELALSHRKHLRTHQSRITYPTANHQRQNQIENPRADKRNEGNRQQESRE